MSNYRRIRILGGTFFFTLVTYRRTPFFVDDDAVEVLRDAFRRVKNQRDFHIDAIVILPDHLHCILKLPEQDSDYAGRWREIKKLTSRKLSPDSNVQRKRNVWQKRFWEHAIRDEKDWRQHMDYIHYNPVKHGLVSSPADWRWSSFHKFVERGWYEASWGGTPPDNIKTMEFE